MTPKPMTRKALVLLVAIGALACGTTSERRSAPGLSGIELSSPVVKAGERVTVTVSLVGPARARAGAVTVYVGFDGEAFAGPREVRIPNGQTSASFTLYSKPSVREARSGAISACTLTPEPYSLLTRSISVIPGVAHATQSAASGAAPTTNPA
jgi:hypothetical protein